LLAQDCDAARLEAGVTPADTIRAACAKLRSDAAALRAQASPENHVAPGFAWAYEQVAERMEGQLEAVIEYLHGWGSYPCDGDGPEEGIYNDAVRRAAETMLAERAEGEEP
jgi:hypothetical protein